MRKCGPAELCGDIMKNVNHIKFSGPSEHKSDIFFSLGVAAECLAGSSFFPERKCVILSPIFPLKFGVGRVKSCEEMWGSGGLKPLTF